MLRRQALSLGFFDVRVGDDGNLRYAPCCGSLISVLGPKAISLISLLLESICIMAWSIRANGAL